MAAPKVNLFLPALAGRPYAERHPYGPDERTTPAAFYADLQLTVGSDVSATARALAVLRGHVWCFADPGGKLCTLVLVPAPDLVPPLVRLLRGPVCFVYRHIDLADVVATLGPKVKARTGDKKTPEERLTSFLNGESFQPVQSGEILGLAGRDPVGNADAYLGLEVLFIPQSFGDFDERSALLRSMINVAQQRRRLDPADFFSRIKRGMGGDPPLVLEPSHVEHPLFTEMTRRVLLEVRDEYDHPWAGTVLLGGQAKILDPTRLWSHLDVGKEPIELNFKVGERIIAELPSGPSQAELQRSCLPPAHVAVQGIFMVDKDDPAQWFVKPAAPFMRRFSKGNTVTLLLDGIPMFADALGELDKVNGPGHQVRLGAWNLELDFPLNPQAEESERKTLREVYQRIAASGAQIKAILWGKGVLKLKLFSSATPPEVFIKEMDLDGRARSAATFINLLMSGANGRAIVDTFTMPIRESLLPVLGSIDVEGNAGSHHQKFMILTGSGGPVAYCGGMDFSKNRLETPAHDRLLFSYHDTHAKVVGPAVVELDQTFVERWNRSLDVVTGRQPRIEPMVSDDQAVGTGSHYVQVSRTYPRGLYPDLPAGDRGSLNALLRAIERARRYIYIEEQYLTPYPGHLPYNPAEDEVGLTKALIDALRRQELEFLLIVIPNHSDQPEGRIRRHRFITALKNADQGKYADKVLVYWLRRKRFLRPLAEEAEAASLVEEIALWLEDWWGVIKDGGALLKKFLSIFQRMSGAVRTGELFSHTKAWVIDDVYAKIGSCNLNRRGFIHDSELDLHVIDGTVESGRRAFALAMRRAIWGEHLRLPPSAIPEDPLAAIALWKRMVTAKKGRPRPYIETDEITPDPTVDDRFLDTLWDVLIDPKG